MAKNNSESRERVLIFDTTLRDGEQAHGAAMTLESKIKVAAMLDRLGVDIIETGFPKSSKGSFNAVVEVAKHIKKAKVCALTPAIEADIDLTAQALSGVPRERRRIHTFIGTSPTHRARLGTGKTQEEILEIISHSVGYARRHTDDVEWSAEDAVRTEAPFLLRAVQRAIQAGATTINIPDTVGYATPWEYFDLIKKLRTESGAGEEIIFSTHCHNDLGMAVVNSIAGVRAGARQVECTINGIGERAGNAALEEVVMAIKTRKDFLPYVTNIRSKALTRVSGIVSKAARSPVQFNKAIVGRNAFAHESGIHQDGVMKNPETYEVMKPSDVGAKRSLPLGKLSGRRAFRKKIEDLGFPLETEAFEGAFARFKDLADEKQEIFDADILELLKKT